MRPIRRARPLAPQGVCLQGAGALSCDVVARGRGRGELFAPARLAPLRSLSSAATSTRGGGRRRTRHSLLCARDPCGSCTAAGRREREKPPPLAEREKTNSSPSSSLPLPLPPPSALSKQPHSPAQQAAPGADHHPQPVHLPHCLQGARVSPFPGARRRRRRSRPKDETRASQHSPPHPQPQNKPKHRSKPPRPKSTSCAPAPARSTRA